MGDLPGTTVITAEDGTPLSVREAGETGQPALVALHGITSSAATWDAVRDVLAQSFRLIMPDLRGHGASGHPESGYDEATFASDLQSVIDQLELDRPLVLGHSLGARIALGWAARYPHTASGIVLEDPPVSPPANYAVDFPRLMRMVRMPVDELAAQMHANNPAMSEDDARRYAERLVQTSPQVFAGVMRELEDRGGDVLPAGVEKITSPVLIVRGEPGAGGVLPDADAALLATALPSASVVTIAEGPHNLHRERTDAFLAVVLPFLRDHAPARR